jgi:aspartyl-tRNA(Asn)/glutamyl-tRNA(Gln) amidotransferase subunit A
MVRWRSSDEPVDAALVRLTAPFNLTGLPALSVPFGTAGGLPVGVQVVGQWNDEVRVLAVGRLLEEEAPTLKPRKREREISR